MTEPNASPTTTPAPRILSRVLLIEMTTENDGVREVETREASVEEMAELGWVRADPQAFPIFDKSGAVTHHAHQVQVIPDLEANGHGVKPPLEYELNVMPQRGKLISERAWELAREGVPTGYPVTMSVVHLAQAIDERFGRSA